MAIADAVMHQLVETTKCKTLFITHYPLVASKLENRFPLDVQNLHMNYEEESRIDGTREIVFLYHLTSGIASGDCGICFSSRHQPTNSPFHVESFGIECGRLAGLPESILAVASKRSSDMQQEVEKRTRRNRYDLLFRGVLPKLVILLSP